MKVISITIIRDTVTVFLKNGTQGNIYNENKRGTRMEPCGTPQLMPETEEYKWSIWTERALPIRCNLNQFKALALTPSTF